VKVIVDTNEKQKEFTVAKIYLTHYSSYFVEKLTNDDIKEIFLPDNSAEIFGFFVQWLITRTIQVKVGQDRQLIQYAKFYTMAKDFKVAGLAEPVLRLAILRQEPDNQSGNSLRDFSKYAFSHKEEVLKHLAVKKTMCSLNKENIDDVWDKLPQGMIVPLLKALAYGSVRLTNWGSGKGFDGLHHVLQKRERNNDDEDDSSEPPTRKTKNPPKKSK
jgi:hypothetical protein